MSELSEDLSPSSPSSFGVEREKSLVYKGETERNSLDDIKRYHPGVSENRINLNQTHEDIDIDEEEKLKNYDFHEKNYQNQPNLPSKRKSKDNEKNSLVDFQHSNIEITSKIKSKNRSSSNFSDQNSSRSEKSRLIESNDLEEKKSEEDSDEYSESKKSEKIIDEDSENKSSEERTGDVISSQRNHLRQSKNLKKRNLEDNPNNFFLLFQEELKTFRLSCCERLFAKGDKEICKIFKCFVHFSSKDNGSKRLINSDFPEFIIDESVREIMIDISFKLKEVKYKKLSLYHLRYLIFHFPSIVNEKFKLINYRNISECTQLSINFINQNKQSITTLEQLIVLNFQSFIVYLDFILEKRDIRLDESNIQPLFISIFYREHS